MNWLARILTRFRPPPRYPSQAGPVAPFDEADMVRRHNVERIRHGDGGPLRADALLSSIATRRAAAAAAAGLAPDRLHDGFGRVDVPGAARTGENAAIGQVDAESVMETWMASAGHRANILEPDFSRMGAARSISGDGATYWYVIFAG